MDSEEGVVKGISVAQYFESNGVPYYTFEKWYKKKFSKTGIVDCVVSSEPDGSLKVPEGGKAEPVKKEKLCIPDTRCSWKQRHRQ